jgi:hypothetical protein
LLFNQLCIQQSKLNSKTAKENPLNRQAVKLLLLKLDDSLWSLAQDLFGDGAR